MSTHLIKSGFILSSMTLISRTLGLIRDIVLANIVGSGADVFFFANRIPNFLRRIFAEGAFAQAFIPVLTEIQAQGNVDRMRELIAKASGTLGGFVAIVTLLGIIFSGFITAVFGFGWFIDWLSNGASASKFELASLLLKITFPYLWFVTLVALSGSILNVLGQFAVSSFTPVFLNACVIGFAVFLSPRLTQPEIGLAIGVFSGGLVQFAFQLPFLKRAGLLVRPRWGWNDPNVARIRKLMIPALLGISISQINLLLDTLMASLLQSGSVSWLYYSDRLIEFPLGLFGVTIATLILPILSERYVNSEPEKFSRTIDWGIKMVFLLGIPAMFGLMVLAKPIILVLFMHGEFSLFDVKQCSSSLLAYASGLLSLMLIKVLVTGYYSRQDTKTPVRLGVLSMLANIVLNGLLAWLCSYVGLAIATSISSFMYMVSLYRGLHSRNIYRLPRETVLFFLRILLATTVMVGTVSHLLGNWDHWLGWSPTHKIIILTSIITFGGMVYFSLLIVQGVRPSDLKVATA